MKRARAQNHNLAATFVLSTCQLILVPAFLIARTPFQERTPLDSTATATAVARATSQQYYYSSNQCVRSKHVLAASSSLGSETTLIYGADAHPTHHSAQHGATEAAAAAAAAVPPLLSQGDREWETFVSKYRIRPKRESESLANPMEQCVWVLDHTERVAENGGVDEAMPTRGDLEDDSQDYSHNRSQRQRPPQRDADQSPSSWPIGDIINSSIDRRNVLIVEDLHGDNVDDGNYGYVGFCGAVGPQGAANATATIVNVDVYVCTRGGQEVDRVTAGLLVRALRGWLGGPEAAAAPVAVRKWSRSQSQGWLRVEGTREDGGEADGGEMVDWVDTRGRVICALSRNVVHAMNVLHRGAGVMIRNEKGEIYCHRRTSTKRIFPSMYDMFIGGVSATMEPALTTALRELGEELGLGPMRDGNGDAREARGGDDLLVAPVHRGECLIQTGHNRCVVSVFDYVVAPGETVRWQEEEVDWGGFLSWEEVESKVSSGEFEFVPDGLQVWIYYLDWMARSSSV